MKQRAAATITDRLYYLNELGISAKSVLDNPFLLMKGKAKRSTSNFRDIFNHCPFCLDDLEYKIVVIKTLKPRDINDFVPLLALDLKMISKLDVDNMKVVYIISEKMKVKAPI